MCSRNGYRETSPRRRFNRQFESARRVIARVTDETLPTRIRRSESCSTSSSETDSEDGEHARMNVIRRFSSGGFRAFGEADGAGGNHPYARITRTRVSPNVTGTPANNQRAVDGERPPNGRDAICEDVSSDRGGNVIPRGQAARGQLARPIAIALRSQLDRRRRRSRKRVVESVEESNRCALINRWFNLYTSLF